MLDLRDAPSQSCAGQLSYDTLVMGFDGTEPGEVITTLSLSLSIRLGQGGDGRLLVNSGSLPDPQACLWVGLPHQRRALAPCGREGMEATKVWVSPRALARETEGEFASIGQRSGDFGTPPRKCAKRRAKRVNPVLEWGSLPMPTPLRGRPASVDTMSPCEDHYRRNNAAEKSKASRASPHRGHCAGPTRNSRPSRARGTQTSGASHPPHAPERGCAALRAKRGTDPPP